MTVALYSGCCAINFSNSASGILQFPQSKFLKFSIRTCAGAFEGNDKNQETDVLATILALLIPRRLGWRTIPASTARWP